MNRVRLFYLFMLTAMLGIVIYLIGRQADVPVTEFRQWIHNANEHGANLPPYEPR